MDNSNQSDQPENNSVISNGYTAMSSNGIVTSDQNNKMPNNLIKAVLVFVVLVVVGGLAAYVAFHNNQTKPSKTVATAGDEIPFKYQATVVIQNHQVVPATISVHPQTDMYIENHDSVDYHLDTNQLNSDSTFSLTSNGKSFSYVEDAFADNITIPANGGYSYVFVTKGTYYYHDINNPNISGEVIVN